jgi:ABC-type sugar transport system ATPase subunit
VTQLPPRARDVEMVFQDYALYPHMTVHDNIGYPLKVRGTDKTELTQQVTSVANQLQIGNLLDRRPAQLSGGQQQRAALARAVVHHAQVFLFDEPLSNLDAKLRLEARAFLKHLQQEVDVTAVYVTHDQAEAMALADRIVVMNQGKIMQVGTPQDIYRTPANTFVASFIGSPPMNLIPSKISDGTLVIDPDGVAHRLTLDRLPDGEAHSLGIRPEYIIPHAEQVENSIPAEQYVTQMLGSESLIIVRVGEHLVTVRLFGDETPEYPQTVWLTFNQDRLYFYDAAGELLQ